MVSGSGLVLPSGRGDTGKVWYIWDLPLLLNSKYFNYFNILLLVYIWYFDIIWIIYKFCLILKLYCSFNFFCSTQEQTNHIFVTKSNISRHWPALPCPALHYTALHCMHYTAHNYTATTLHCTELHNISLHCTLLHCTELYCNICTAWHCTALHYTGPHCTTLYCTAQDGTTLPCWTALHYGVVRQKRFQITFLQSKI